MCSSCRSFNGHHPQGRLFDLHLRVYPVHLAAATCATALASALVATLASALVGTLTPALLLTLRSTLVATSLPGRGAGRIVAFLAFRALVVRVRTAGTRALTVLASLLAALVVITLGTTLLSAWGALTLSTALLTTLGALALGTTLLGTLGVARFALLAGTTLGRSTFVLVTLCHLVGLLFLGINQVRSRNFQQMLWPLMQIGTRSGFSTSSSALWDILGREVPAM